MILREYYLKRCKNLNNDMYFYDFKKITKFKFRVHIKSYAFYHAFTLVLDFMSYLTSVNLLDNLSTSTVEKPPNLISQSTP